MTDLKPIRTEADYEAAMAEVERLWGAPAGTADGDRLDVLATLIDAYESERDPMDPPDPGDVIEPVGCAFEEVQPLLRDPALGRELGRGRAGAPAFELAIDEDPACILDIGLFWEGYGDQCLQMEFLLHPHANQRYRPYHLLG